MPVKKRTPFELEKDRAEIAKLYLKGVYQADIAARLGMSRDMVTHDLKVIREQWRKSAIVDFNERQAVELAKIDNLEVEYWDAWERSKLVKESSLTKMIELGQSSRNEASVKQEQQVGDPRFLDGVRWCVERRIKIFGLDAPIKIDWREKLPDGYSAEEVQQQFMALLAMAAQNDSSTSAHSTDI